MNIGAKVPEAARSDHLGISDFFARNKKNIADLGKMITVIAALVEGGGAAWQFYAEKDIRAFEQEQKAWAVLKDFAGGSRAALGNIGQVHAIEFLISRHVPLNGIKLDSAELGQMVAKGALMSGVHLTGSNLTGANFDGADLRHSQMSGQLQKTSFHNAHIADASFAGAELQWADFTGAIFYEDGFSPSFIDSCYWDDSRDLNPKPVGLPPELMAQVQPCRGR